MWSLKEDGKNLEPKIFSNGKNQQDIVKEVLEAIEQGNKVIFIHGVCGSGKSAIALNIAKELGKASIVVPIKNLQKQYEQDYVKTKQIFKDSGEKLKINMITGRNNHPCPYLEDNKQEIRETRKIEANANIHDIFKQIKGGSLDTTKPHISDDKSADNKFIPCKIEIKEKNIQTLKKYYKENSDKKNIGHLNLKYMKRMAVAPACPFWSPILPTDLKVNLEADKKEYNAIHKEHAIYQRKPGCPYYKQFHSYADSDVIMFNSMQYLLETGLGRKPATEVEIIDECDEFLDKLAAEGTINFNRLRSESSFLYPNEDGDQQLINALNNILREAYDECREKAANQIILPVKDTKILELLKLFSKNDYLPMIQDEDSYLEKTADLCKKFSELADETYVSFYRIPDRKDFGVKLVTINLDKVFNGLLDKNKVFVMMSGTLHNERVLKEIFGIDRFKIINAEIINQGNISKKRTGLEADFKYENFKNGTLTREDYLRALDLSIGMAEKPAVVHVNAFADLPSFQEIEEFGLKNLISNDELREKQINDKNNEIVMEFKQGKADVLFTTRCNRGVDFPYDTCKSTIITKFPYPNTQSLFWQILKRQKPTYFWDFYKDKAHRELLQKIYRSVRAKDDHVNLYSPDKRVIESGII